MLIVSMLALQVIAASPAPLAEAMPIRVVGDWTLEAGPGAVHVGERTVTLTEAVTLTVDPAELAEVRDECYSGIPVFDAKGAGWRKGVRLQKLITQECSATGLLVSESVRVKPGPGDTPPFALDADYGMDMQWATLGLKPDGAIGHRQTVYIDYDWRPCRLDSVVVDGAGKARIIRGEPGAGVQLPPEPGEGETVIANIWVPGWTERLGDENVFAIDFGQKDEAAAPAEAGARLVPKTLAKLRAGEEVTVVAWGDSVTCGGGVGGCADDWYQNQFADRLRQRFPKARVRVLNAGWGGASSRMYLEAPAGGTYDFVRDVLEPKADLVVIEFVNDAGLNEEQVQSHYGPVVKRIQETGAEVILITPHLVRPDWLKVSGLKFDEDPRAYVKGLRRFAAENDVALADASVYWCRLWRQGIPYVTLLANSINHPDARGHALFADALMGFFPAE